jgi:hypothetical protein
MRMQDRGNSISTNVLMTVKRNSFDRVDFISFNKQAKGILFYELLFFLYQKVYCLTTFFPPLSGKKKVTKGTSPQWLSLRCKNKKANHG